MPLVAQNPVPVQTFYLPMPEGQLLEVLQSIEGGTTWIADDLTPVNPIQYYVSIAAVSDGTVIYYDHMEDGYESEISNPTSIYDATTNPAGTQIWGDGDPSNGAAPGIPSDLISAGSVIILNNPIDSTVAPNPAAPLFRASDKIASSKAIAMTFAGWASGSATLLAGANEIFDTVSWGIDYRIPVGENIADSTDFQMFEYTGAAVMAGEGGASVQIDADADGLFESTVNLSEGQSHLINGGLNVGGRFLSSAPVQVDLVTGDRQDGYESRFCRLLPVSLWANSYYTPVSTPTSAQGYTGTSTSVWLYNPGTSPIDLTYQRRGGANLVSNVTNKTVAYASQPLSGSAPGNVYGPLVELNSNGTLTGPSPEGAWIGVVDRSNSNSPTVESKVVNAQAAGAAAVIIVRNGGGTTFPTESAGSPVIPVVGMTENGGAAMRAAGIGAGWVRVSGDQVSSTLTVPPRAYVSQILTDGYGARFFTPGGQEFYALSTTDSGGNVLSGDAPGSNRTWDWGFTLVPESSLTPQVLIGLGIGRDPTSAVNPNENGNPVWITTTGNGNSNAAVFVDFDSDPTTGPLTDANGNQYDLVLTLREYEMAKIYNPAGNQSGVLLYTLDPGVKLAAAWGQDVLQATTGQPGLDMGTGIPPLPQFVGAKKSVLFVDNDGDGYISPGDVLEYVITITNISRVPVSDLELEDVLPDSLSYQPGTTRFKDAAGVESGIPDGGSGSAFPLYEGGIVLSQSSLPPNGATWEISYRALVIPSENLLPGEFNIINSAVIGGVSVSDPIVLQETQQIFGQIGDRIWIDINGNGLQDSGELGIPGITARLLDASNSVLDTAISDENGWYRFFGVLPGTYRVEFSLPTGYNFSPLNADAAGLAGGSNSDAAPLTGRTVLFDFGAGEHQLAVDAGLVPIVGPLGILKTSDADGFVNPGDVIEYTVVVTNSGITPQTEVAISDLLHPQTTLVPGSVQASLDPPLNPGGTFTVDFNSSGTFTVPEGVTSLTVEAWGAGGGGGKSSTSNDNAGGGGGGGGYGRSTVAVTPNSPLTVSVGAGGAAGNPGGDSWFGSSSTVRGGGGSGGGATSTAGGAGATSNIGTLATFDGGSGGNGHASGNNNNRRGGGGGGSATHLSAGGNGADGASESGGGGGIGEANGGVGRQSSDNGMIGNSPGGGGGGGGRNAIGGSGGNGRVRVTYTVPAGVSGTLGSSPDIASGWTIPAGASLTLTFQAVVNSPALGTQIINTATVTSNEAPEPASSTVFDTLAPGSISGSVLADTDGDDLGNTGMAGVVLALHQGNGTPVLGQGGNPVTTLTDDNGSYVFGNVAPGIYQVWQAHPAGYLSVSDSDGGNPDRIGDNDLIQVLSARNSANNDFVELQLGFINGTVLSDTTGDGSGDTPLAGVTVILLDDDDEPIATTVTLANGSYQFPNLIPGIYTVVETDPTGYFSLSLNSVAAMVPPGGNVTVDFTDTLPGSISGSVLADGDNDGNGETALPGVTLALLDAHGDPVLDGGGLPISTTTGANGVYLFDSLLPGVYQVSETQPSGYASVSDIDGGDLDINGDTTAIVVLPGQAVTGQDFVEIEFGSLNGCVLADTSGDGSGDIPLEGVSVTLMDDDGEPVATTTTLANGTYNFPDLIPGDYTVVESDPSGYLSLTPNHVAAVVPPGGSAMVDFTDTQPGSISGFVLAGSDPLSGVSLTLLDADGDPVDGDPETPGVQPVTTVTDSLGFYRFDGLLPGIYQVGQAQPEGYDSFGDLDGGDVDIIGDVTAIILAPGQQSENNTFSETLDTCPDDWAQWKFQHPGEQADGNPDGDAYDNLAEFAFAMPAFRGTGSPWLGNTAWVIQPSSEFPGTLEGVFVRPRGATADVTYTLQYASGLGNPTAWQSIAIVPGMTDTDDNDDCTETVTILDLETVTGLTGGSGFVRIRVDLDEDPPSGIDHTSYTEVEGWKETPLEICCRTYNNPFLRESVFTGTISAVSGQDLTFIAGGEPGLATGGGVFHYLEVMSGDHEGHRFDIAGVNGNQVTLANDGDLNAANAPFNTRVGAPPATLAGDQVVIRRHWTLAEIFPPSGFGASDDRTTADLIQLFAAGQWSNFWLYDDGVQPARWVRTGDNTYADQGSLVVAPGQGMFFNNRTAVTSILAYGEIRSNHFVRPLAPGSNLVGGGYPLDQSAASANGREMTLANGFFGSRDIATADSVFIWDGDSTIGANGYSTYFLNNNAPRVPAVLKWVKVGDAGLLSRDAETLLLGDHSVFLRSKDGAPEYTVPSPWNP